MDIIEARALVATLYAFPRGSGSTPVKPLRAALHERHETSVRSSHDGRAFRTTVDGGRIVFTGGRYGDHSLDTRTSSRERVLAHWAGYCKNNTVA